jgi:hypothetical protein
MTGELYPCVQGRPLKRVSFVGSVGQGESGWLSSQGVLFDLAALAESGAERS